MYNKSLLFLKSKIRFEDINKPILISALLLLIAGFLSFFSASLGFLNKADSEEYFTNFVQMQMVSYIIGFSMLILLYFISLIFISKASLIFFGLSILSGLLIFIPGLEIEHGGGARWVAFNGFSFQPGDLIKFATILLFANYFTKYQSRLSETKFGLLYPISAISVISLVFFLQRDLGTLSIILLTVGGMYILNNTSFKYIVGGVAIGASLIAAYISINTYALDRINGLFTESYQTKQALIALGSGGLLGRGYGQSVQKFFHLPEPAGDSIFAVLGEEFGFVGTLTVTVLFMTLIICSYIAARKCDNIFIQNLIYGIILLYFLQFVVNTGSMTKLIPLSGDTLPFFSKGGSSLIMNLAELGILLRLTRKDN